MDNWGSIQRVGRLSALRDRHQGERAVLVANGPSLNRMDLSFLRGECVIGLNKIFLGIKRFGFFPRYYVAVNEKVIRQSTKQIQNLNCVKFIGDNGASGLLTEDPLTYIVNTSKPPSRFCTDISKGMHEGWTVTYAALQVAYFLGFREILIIGMDHRYEYDGAPNEARQMGKSDPNHFCNDYFANMTWDNPDLARSEESYRLARQVYEADDRRIIDATLDGACKVFEKQDYRSLFLTK